MPPRVVFFKSFSSRTAKPRLDFDFGVALEFCDMKYIAAFQQAALYWPGQA